MLGVVFCGGKSSRMGTDKGLIPLVGKNWAQNALERLSALNIPVKLSINALQKENYSCFFTEDLLLLDEEALGISGPLLGLLSTHLKYPDDDLFILACDLPLMKDKLLKTLFKAEREEYGFEAFVFTSDGVAEPLCAIYKSTGLKKIRKELNEKGLTNYSMKYVLGMLNVFEFSIPPQEKDAFRNFNTHGLT